MLKDCNELMWITIMVLWDCIKEKKYEDHKAIEQNTVFSKNTKASSHNCKHHQLFKKLNFKG